MAESNHGPWIIAVAIVLAAGVIVGGLLYMRAEDQKRAEECREWQAEVSKIAAVTDFDSGEVGGILEEQRPEGCDAPAGG